MKIAAVQMRSTPDPAVNAATAERLVREAAARGATYVQTPEVTNLMQRDRAAAAPLIASEADDVTLAALRAAARATGTTVHVGSVVVREEGRLRNRAVLIGPDGGTIARYDKIHMFDVDLPSGERYRESAAYAPGERALLADLGALKLGITICFDVRFPRLYEELALVGANVLTAPSAFAVPTGEAHWHTLLRARAIENGAFMVAAAQEGTHDDGRMTYGHALIVAPWGTVLAEATQTPSVVLADIDLADADRMRAQIPVLSARRAFTLERVDGATVAAA